MHRRVAGFFACWKGQFCRLWNAEMWKMVLSYLMWCIWRERNDRSLKDRERTVEELKDFFFKTLYLWTFAFGLNFFLAFMCLLIFFFFF
jgi:hypothetical protein